MGSRFGCEQRGVGAARGISEARPNEMKDLMHSDQPQGAGLSSEPGFEDDLPLPDESSGMHRNAKVRGAGEQLAASQRAIIAAAAERILPRTGTPGAIDVGVPDFVAVMYGSYLDDAEKARLVRGLSQLDSLSATAHQRGFAKLEAGQQDAVLRQLAESADQEDGRCFQQLRELTVLGFFSSKTIGTTVLKYDPIPGRYEGNIPLSETGGASWYMA